jgi:hypothetical protein
MHVEAMNWSGTGVREYAAALSLSSYALRKWGDRPEDGVVEIDWRVHLHPPRTPKPCGLRKQLDSSNKGRFTGPGTPARRFLSGGQKLAIMDTEQRPDGLRHYSQATAQKKRTRPPPSPTLMAAARVLRELVQPPDGMMAVDLAGGRRVFVTAGGDPDAVLARLESRKRRYCLTRS